MLAGTEYNNKTKWPEGFDTKASEAINIDSTIK
jgi:hypothetical protein